MALIVPGMPACSTSQLAKPLDIAFILDTSSSVSDQQWTSLQKFVTLTVTLLGVAPEQNRYSLVAFDNGAKVHLHLSAFTKESAFARLLNDLERSKSELRDISEGIRVAVDEVFLPRLGDRPKSPNVIILVTTGPSSVSSEVTRSQVHQAANSGILLLVIHLDGEQPNQNN